MLFVSFLLTLAALAVNLAAGAAGFSVVAGVAKMTASCGFLGVAFASGALSSPYGRLLFAGLVLSWWGDLFLIFRGWFLWGLIAFFLAHTAYAAAFIAHGVSWSWTASAVVLLALPVLLIHRWLMPHAGDLRVPVLAYMAIITLMVSLAAGTLGRGAPWLILAGALFFYCSDIFVARGRFVAPGPMNGLIGLPLYYFGQLALAYSPRLLER